MSCMDDCGYYGLFMDYLWIIMDYYGLLWMIMDYSIMDDYG